MLRDAAQLSESRPHVDHPALTPTRIGELKLRNRLVVAPMSRVSATEEGVATEAMAQYYGRFAAGGFGLVITEGVYPDHARSQAYWRQPGIATSEQAEGWRPIADTIRERGAASVMQLMHAGPLIQENPRSAHGLAPSAVPPKGSKMPEYGGRGPYATPKAMSKGDFEQVREGFVQAAQRAIAVGFDGIEIHGANGYLLDQFITTYANNRDDRYGGSPEARIRFPVEVVEAVRRAVPDNAVVGYRMSQTKVNDFDYRWPGGAAEARVYFDALAEAGVDYLHIASEGRDWIATAALEPGVTITRLARSVAEVPVIANGGMHDPTQAHRVLREGHADLLSLGRGALANPDWPRRLRNRESFDTFDHDMLSPSASLKNADNWRTGR